MTEKLVNIMGNENFYYVAVKGSPFANDCSVFGLTNDEVLALTKRFPNSGASVVNGVLIKEATREVENRGKTGNDRTCCEASSRGTVGVRQTLSELDFERGIWYAAQTNDIDRVEDLLRKGVSPNVQDGAGYTALHYASRGGHLEVCKALMRNGAHVDAVTRCGKATSLHRSSMRGDSTIVEYLLSCGSDPNIRDSDGYTALHRSILANSSAVCRLLIPVTDLNIRDNNSRTPFQMALDFDYPDLIRLFKSQPDDL